MLAFIAALAALIAQLTPLISTVVGMSGTVKQLFDLGSQVMASGADPTHEQWATLSALQVAALAQVHKPAQTAANA